MKKLLLCLLVVWLCGCTAEETSQIYPSCYEVGDNQEIYVCPVPNKEGGFTWKIMEKVK